MFTFVTVPEMHKFFPLFPPLYISYLLFFFSLKKYAFMHNIGNVLIINVLTLHKPCINPCITPCINEVWCNVFEWFSVITPQNHCTIDVFNVVYAVVLCIDNLTFISNESIVFMWIFFKFYSP